MGFEVPQTQTIPWFCDSLFQSSSPGGTCRPVQVGPVEDFEPDLYKVPQLHRDLVQSENALKIHLGKQQEEKGGGFGQNHPCVAAPTT